MFQLSADTPAELVPLSWLIGSWAGSGILSYRLGEELHEAEFAQEIVFTPGPRQLHYAMGIRPVDEADDGPRFSETGYWALQRPLGAADRGPGLLTATEPERYTTADEVETLRNDSGGFDIEVLLVQDAGVSELYLGTVTGPRIDLGTDAVLRSGSAKDYSGATRMYGLVDGHLLWAWDIAALGQDLRTHASGRLARVD